MNDARLTKTPTTVANMKAAMRNYATFLRDEKHVTPESFFIENFESDTAREFINYLIAKGNLPQSINQIISVLRAIFKDIGIKDHKFKIIYSEWASIEKLKFTKGDREEPISEKGIDSILKASANDSSRAGLKYFTMIIMAYYTATRIDEMLDLKVTNLKIDIPKPYIIVTGKGRKERCIPIDNRIVKKLRRYLAMSHGNELKESDYVFSNNRGQKLTPQGVNKYLKQLAHKARQICMDVPQNLHFHQFRKARATHLHEHGMPIEQISELLGHESITTTMVYLGISKDMKFKAINSILPSNIRSEKPRYTNDVVKLFDYE